ncbi:MAG TPA: hypothetical protein VNR00_13275, partial [Opitutus sp.]|nr:hypothetical protein [Opitutus sp.]
TAVARANNQGAAWNEAHNSLGENWGHGPTVAEHVPVTVTLAGLAGREVFALKPDGSRGARVETESADGALTFAARPAYQTLHYEIVAR